MDNSDHSRDSVSSRKNPAITLFPGNSTILQKHMTGRSLFGREYTTSRLVLIKRLVKVLGWNPGLRIRQEVVNGCVLLTPAKGI